MNVALRGSSKGIGEIGARGATSLSSAIGGDGYGSVNLDAAILAYSLVLAIVGALIAAFNAGVVS